MSSVGGVCCRWPQTIAGKGCESSARTKSHMWDGLSDWSCCAHAFRHRPHRFPGELYSFVDGMHALQDEFEEHVGCKVAPGKGGITCNDLEVAVQKTLTMSLLM